ncbi:sensor histidine kinase [Salininema proteolyticum]|uniref:histidine kinase n=1 Tax=Salininema proteolyticum TaxID=1607685 RepID=A0ABV8U408_9ACTN
MLHWNAPWTSESVWVLAEPVLLAVAAYCSARWSSSARAAGWAVAATCAASGMVILRFSDLSVRETVLAAVIWALLPAAFAGAAWYQRLQGLRRRRAVAEARRAQRLELAHDLHDFAAHDISEVVAQAQAGRMVLPLDDPRVADLLERIESAGLRALGSMDRTVRLLRETEEVDVSPVRGVADLPGLVERFNAAGRPRAVFDSRLCGEVGREAGAVIHRLVTEALTNVRRHAPDAAEVSVALEESEGMLSAVVSDDGRARRPRGRSSSGSGLAGLSDRVEALGGTFRAGPREGGGWLVEARIPWGRPVSQKGAV